MRDSTRANMSRASATTARRGHKPFPRQFCSTFDAAPGRVVTTITVTNASTGECVLRTAELDTYEVRETLPWVHATWPRGEGWAITLDAKVAHA